MNIALGYFVNLVVDIVGGSVAPDPDKSTHGTQADIAALVVGENEKENPLKQSYAVEKGFKATDHVVSVFSGYPQPPPPCSAKKAAVVAMDNSLWSNWQ